MKKLFLLDAMALIYRAHFALSKSPRVSSKGLNTSASFGFTNTLLEVLQKEKPTHIAVGFDLPGPTFRHEQFTEYKAHRQEQPEDITINIPYIRRIIEGFGIPILEKPGYEADDIIGTVATEAGKRGFNAYMMTSDKDYGQLVNENVFIYKPAFMGNAAEVLDAEKVKLKFGISSVDQVRDILGLMGDAVDNIPGIPGIGEKTAQKLIAEFGSVENLIANVDKLKGKQQENVQNFAQQGIMSKELATIITNVPVEFNEEALLYSGPIREKLEPLFEELEFRTLKKRVFGDDTSPSGENATSTQKSSSQSSKSKAKDTNQMDMFGAVTVSQSADIASVEESTDSSVHSELENIHTRKHRYKAVVTVEQCKNLAGFLSLQTEFCFDTETDNLDALQANLVGFSFSYIAQEAFYVPVPENKEQAQVIVDIFKPVLENKQIRKIGQNIKYDILVLQNYGVTVQGELFDTMLAHYLIDPDTRHNMDVLAENYLGYSTIHIDELIGKKGKNQGTMRDVELSLITDYAAEDADVTFQLKQIFAPKIHELELGKLLLEVETPLVPVLADMEREGVKIDTGALGEISGILQKDITELEQAIYQAAGESFNIASPKQLGEILFEKLKLDPKAKKTKTGQYATGEEILSKLAYEHPIAAQILDIRELQKLKSTYVDALPMMVNAQTGRVHTSYNQAVAATGRLSSTNPNLQNIPIRTDRGKEIRKAFVPRNEEFTIFSADYSQIELRIMAEFSQDVSMLNAFKNGIDIHTNTASKVFKVGIDEVNSEMRRKAKMVNFGIIYGISAFGLSQRLDIPRKEAAEIIEAYFAEFPTIKSYMDASINQGREHGYVSTILGRRRYLRDINSANQTLRGFAERNAINAPIQGSAADMIKVAMINIHHKMKAENLKSKMILQVHDELVFDAHKDELEILKPMVDELMKTAIPMQVPMEIGLGTGVNWLEAH
ncbi:MAG: DNA polymerase I [Cytophagales bacterium]